MSRIGKNPVEVPGDVEVTIDGLAVTAKGKLGELRAELTPEVTVAREENLIWVKPANHTKRARMMWGTSRSQIQNLVTGVSDGFTYHLEISGVGYRAAVQDGVLNLQLGYSHDINYPIPEGVTVKVERNTQLEIHGADKAAVGQFASEIRKFRPPEPYKGKGVKYRDEYILRKEGKKK